MIIGVTGYKVDPILSQYLSLYERNCQISKRAYHSFTMKSMTYWGNIQIFNSVARPQIESKGTFINDVMQLGGMGVLSFVTVWIELWVN